MTTSRPTTIVDGETQHIIDLIDTYLTHHLGAVIGIERGMHAYEELQTYPPERISGVAQTLLSHSDPHFRLTGAEMLLRLDAQQHLPVVLPLLTDPDDKVRGAMCSLLHGFGDERAMEVVIQVLLEDSDPTNRLHAALALSRIGNREALPALEQAAHHDNGTDWEGRSVRVQAQEAIQAIQKREA